MSACLPPNLYSIPLMRSSSRNGNTTVEADLTVGGGLRSGVTEMTVVSQDSAAAMHIVSGGVGNAAMYLAAPDGEANYIPDPSPDLDSPSC